MRCLHPAGQRSLFEYMHPELFLNGSSSPPSLALLDAVAALHQTQASLMPRLQMSSQKKLCRLYSEIQDFLAEAPVGVLHPVLLQQSQLRGHQLISGRPTRQLLGVVCVCGGCKVASLV